MFARTTLYKTPAQTICHFVDVILPAGTLTTGGRIFAWKLMGTKPHRKSSAGYQQAQPGCAEHPARSAVGAQAEAPALDRIHASFAEDSGARITIGENSFHLGISRMVPGASATQTCARSVSESA